jgi:hypothetical protein
MIMLLEVPPAGNELEPPEQLAEKRERPASSAALAFVREPIRILEIPWEGSFINQ